MAEILLIRHGQASFGSANYDQLSPLGELQGACLGQFLLATDVQLAAVYCGTLLRQQQTAAALCIQYRSAGVPFPVVQVLAGFDEIDNEQQVLKLGPHLAEHDPLVRSWIEQGSENKKVFQKLLQRVFLHWQGLGEQAGELVSWPYFRRAAVAALEQVMARQEAGKTCAIISSGGVIATLVAYVLGMPDTSVYAVYEPVINASVTRLLYRPGQLSLSSYNEHSFLAHTASGKLVTYR